MLRVTIETDNAAFGDGDGDEDALLAELARILHRLASRFEDEVSGCDLGASWEGRLRDTNGNTVGLATLER